MSTKRLDAKCPGCGQEVAVNVDLPDAKVVVQEDTTKVNALAHELDQSQQSAEALRGDLQRWQSGENHLQAADMLRMLQTCPNCKPTWDVAVKAEREQAVKSLTLDQVKEIAKQHRLWPPPTIDLAPGLSRKARE